MKDKIVGGIIGMSSALIVSLIMLFINFKVSGAQALKRDISKKLDKTEYNEDQRQKWEYHDKIHAKDDKRIDEMYIWLKVLYEDRMKK